MSAYRFLQDHSISGAYYQAGTVASTADVGGTLPVNFQPTGACEPLDAPAVAAFYAMGPQLRALIRQQWTGIPWPDPLPTGWRIRTQRSRAIRRANTCSPAWARVCPLHSLPSTQRALAGFIHERTLRDGDELLACL